MNNLFEGPWDDIRHDFRKNLQRNKDAAVAAWHKSTGMGRDAASKAHGRLGVRLTADRYTHDWLQYLAAQQHGGNGIEGDADDMHNYISKKFGPAALEVVAPMLKQMRSIDIPQTPKPSGKVPDFLKRQDNPSNRAAVFRPPQSDADEYPPNGMSDENLRQFHTELRNYHKQEWDKASADLGNAINAGKADAVQALQQKIRYDSQWTNYHDQELTKLPPQPAQPNAQQTPPQPAQPNAQTPPQPTAAPRQTGSPLGRSSTRPLMHPAYITQSPENRRQSPYPSLNPAERLQWIDQLTTALSWTKHGSPQRRSLVQKIRQWQQDPKLIQAFPDLARMHVTESRLVEVALTKPQVDQIMMRLAAAEMEHSTGARSQHTPPPGPTQARPRRAYQRANGINATQMLQSVITKQGLEAALRMPQLSGAVSPADQQAIMKCVDDNHGSVDVKTLMGCLPEVRATAFAAILFAMERSR